MPGAAIGAVGGLVAGGLALATGLPAGYAGILMAALTIPMAALGGGYGLLLGAGVIPLGAFAPAAVYWLVGFPLARLVQEAAAGLAIGGGPLPSEGLPSFLAYQALLSPGFAIGFIWLHERVGGRWWLRVCGHNPTARAFVERYKQQAVATETAKQARRARRSRGERPGDTRQGDASTRKEGRTAQ